MFETIGIKEEMREFIFSLFKRKYENGCYGSVGGFELEKVYVYLNSGSVGFYFNTHTLTHNQGWWNLPWKELKKIEGVYAAQGLSLHVKLEHFNKGTITRIRDILEKNHEYGEIAGHY